MASTASSSILISNALHVLAANQTIETIPSNSQGNERNQNLRNISPLRNQMEHDNYESSDDSFDVEATTTTSTIPLSASTSNTLSQNLIKMLYPLSNFSHQTNDSIINLPNDLESDESFVSDNLLPEIVNETIVDDTTDENVHSLARTFAANVLFDANISSSSKRTQNTAHNSIGSQSSILSNNHDTPTDGKIFYDLSITKM